MILHAHLMLLVLFKALVPSAKENVPLAAVQRCVLCFAAAPVPQWCT